MKPKLSTNVILRVDDNLKRRLANLQEGSGCSISEILRQCMESLAEYYEANHSITLPVAVIPKKELKQLVKSAEKSNPR